MSSVRARFAPSPTGYLHIGGLRTALYNELFAKKNGGVLILRIEDTDQSRYVEGAVENILRTLHWAGIDHDEGVFLGDDGEIMEKGGYGPYFQSKRLDIYREYVDKLLADGKAYRCYCSPERLTEMRQQQQAANRPVMYDRHCREHLSEEDCRKMAAEGQPSVVRLKVPTVGRTEFNDLIRGAVSFPNENIDEQILLKSDGFPTYHLANVVDDHLMNVTHVIRGEEWLPSTPKHIILYEAFGWDAPAFAHLPLLLNPDKSKLSKRQGDVAVEDYRAQGYLPEALLNFVGLLGHNPSGDQELYDKQELIAGFDLERVNKGGAVLNREKLDWMNCVYLKRLPIERLQELALPYLLEKGIVKRDGERLITPEGQDVTARVPRVLKLEQTRAEKVSDLAEGIDYFFDSQYPIDPAGIPWKKSDAPSAAERLKAVKGLLEQSPGGVFEDSDGLNALICDMISKNGWTNGEVLWPTRFALTGQKASPGPFEVIWALGRDESIRRLERAIALLEQ